MLSRSDGALVGVVESVRLVEEPGQKQWYEHVIRVERALKGAFGERVTVESSVDGGTCGIKLPAGGRVGLALDRRAGKAWTTSLCSTADPDALIAAARLPAASGTPRFVAAVAGRTVDATALTARGKPAAYSERDGTPLAVAGCGRTHALAVREAGGRIALGGSDSSLASFGTIKLPLTTVSALHCAGDGTSTWVAGTLDGRTAIVSVPGQRAETIHRGPAGAAVTFAGGEAFLASDGRVDVVTLDTGAVRTVQHAGRFTQLSFSDGRIAGRLADGRGGLLDLTSGGLLVGGRVDGLVWLSRTSLLDAGNSAVLDAQLNVTRRLSGKLGRVVGVAGGSAYLASGKTVRRLKPGARRAPVFAKLPGRVVGLASMTSSARLSQKRCDR